MSKRRRRTRQNPSALADAVVAAIVQHVFADPFQFFERVPAGGALDALYDVVIKDTPHDGITPLLDRVTSPADVGRLRDDIIAQVDRIADDHELYGYLLGMAVGRRIAGGVR